MVRSPLRRRSIPALAGEPIPRYNLPSGRPVYPRACGGTNAQHINLIGKVGLSPRLRGNPAIIAPLSVCHGSIPALAGEPVYDPNLEYQSPVYPRACGGTGQAISLGRYAAGLSPRLRGNPPVLGSNGLPQGSIPALAGEPPTGIRQPIGGKVYPRACGGTGSIAEWTAGDCGLSPRLRGNPQLDNEAHELSRSIPALAGEPCRVYLRIRNVRVYPRACGGTGHFCHADAVVGGLSPRLRGNHTIPGWHLWRVGSIPALAGEPQPGK